MIRRLFTFASAVSLLLCIAVCVLWVRSYWVGDVVELELFRPVPQPVGRNYFSYGVATGRGGVGYVAREGVFGMPPDVLRAKQAALAAGPVWTYRPVPDPAYPYSKPETPPSALNRLGVYYEFVRWGHAGNVDAVTAVTVPFWMLAAATGLLAFPVMLRFIRR